MVGIRAVAERAGVSIATVSRVLNQDPTLSVTDATKDKITEAVKFYNYNKKKKVKGNKKLHIITTTTEENELEDPYFRAIRRGIYKEAEKRMIDISKILRLPEESLNIEEIKKNDGSIIIGHVSSLIIKKAYSANPNVVVIDDPSVCPTVDSVYTDFAKATKEHLDRLYSHGHRNISFIGGWQNIIDDNGNISYTKNEQRKIIYQKWMKEKNLQHFSNMYLEGWTALAGMKSIEKLFDELGEKPLPTAIVVGSDPVAVGVYKGIKKRGYTIPTDISIVSFDNIEFSEFLTPSLSTVNVHIEELGRAAIRLLFERFNYGRHIPVQVVVSNEILVRDSERII